MLQGTGSDVGKSLLVAGLGRVYRRRGLRVLPFKPQNMSNNAAVAADGGEIGRAQALQARACGVPSSVEMNPILLKPEGERGAQLVVRGRVAGRTQARSYRQLAPRLLPEVMASFRRLSADADLVLVEGAGGAAEVNLRDGDVANMGFAEAADVPVVLVGDIERGGVIASLVGTMVLLEGADRLRVGGYLVNKFRGDPELFMAGCRRIGVETGLRCYGIVPWFEAAQRLPAEDSLGVRGAAAQCAKPIVIAVPRLPRCANFDDLDPLALEPDVELRWVESGAALPGDADLVILLGSKTTRADLARFRAEGWDADLRAHWRRGGQVLGICAGFQMLGREIRDPDGVEGPPGADPGLGFLEVETEMGTVKKLAEVAGRDTTSGEVVRGYAMHMGRSTGPGTARALLEIDGQPEGAISVDGRVAGCYVHGLFAADGFRHAFLNRLRPRAQSRMDYQATVETTLDELADHLERCLDTEGLLALARRDRPE